MGGGITAQYGFLFQKYVFIYCAVYEIGICKSIEYEGIDDIDKEHPTYLLSKPNKEFIQVKSGSLKEIDFINVVTNWLNIDAQNEQQNSKKIIYLENEVDFCLEDEELANKILNKIMEGKNKNRRSKFRKAYEYYVEEDKTGDYEANLLDKIKETLENYEKKVFSMLELENKIIEEFSRLYCQDIVLYKLAKERRLKYFISILSENIDEAIKVKNSYVLTDSDFYRFITTVQNAITDDKYDVSYDCLKKNKTKQVQRIIDSSSREVEQLKYVMEGKSDKDIQIIKKITECVMYKDFRDVYEESYKISNLEQEAKSNYDDVIFEYEDANPLKRFIEVRKKNIATTLLPENNIISKGCYIYLTRDDIDKSLQISWKDD